MQAEGGSRDTTTLSFSQNTAAFASRTTACDTTAYGSYDTTAYGSSRAADMVREESEESEVQSESFSEDVASSHSFGKSSIVYNEEEKVIFNRW